MTTEAHAVPALFSLKDRVALVTGSSTGLGKAMAKGLGQAGAKVALNYFNNSERAEKAFSEFTAAGFEGMLVRADVTGESGVSSMMAEIRKTLGPVDILVINATCDQPHKRIEDY